MFLVIISPVVLFLVIIFTRIIAPGNYFTSNIVSGDSLPGLSFLVIISPVILFMAIISPALLFVVIISSGCRMSCSRRSLSMVLSRSCGGIFMESVFASPPMLRRFDLLG